MASKGLCFMVTWTISKKPPVGGRPNTKNREIMALQTLTTILILFYRVWGPAWIEIHWNSIWLRPKSYMTSHYFEDPWHTLHDFGDVLGQPLDTFLGALTISWSRLVARVWSGPYYMHIFSSKFWQRGCVETVRHGDVLWVITRRAGNSITKSAPGMEGGSWFPTGLARDS